MEISQINIANMLSDIIPSGDKSINNLNAKTRDDSLVFEEMMNKIITKELLKPMFASGLISGDQQYAMLMQDTLIEYFNQNLNLISIDAQEIYK